MANEEQKLDLDESYRERGFDGQYEETTHYRLIVRSDDGKKIARLEIEKETRNTGTASSPNYTNKATRDWIKRYEISVPDPVTLIEKNGQPVT